MPSRTLTLLLAALAALALGCGDRGCAGAPASEGGPPGAAAPQRALGPRARILGLWSVGPSRAASEKMKADLRKGARGDEQRLAEGMKQWEASLEGTTLELTPTALITRQHGRQIASEEYEVIGESEQAVTLRLTRGGKERSLMFEGDDTISTELGDLGAVTLRRR